jgi:hypothetical protein
MSEASGRGERPTIELYMYSLNQEFPVASGHQAFLQRRSEVKPSASQLQSIESVDSAVFRLEGVQDWSVQWISNEWIENHTKAVGLGQVEREDPMNRVILREEDFGGIVFDPLSDRVFRLNRSGFELFNRMREVYLAGERDPGSVQAPPGFADTDVREFAAYLEGAGLWIR